MQSPNVHNQFTDFQTGETGPLLTDKNLQDYAEALFGKVILLYFLFSCADCAMTLSRISRPMITLNNTLPMACKQYKHPLSFFQE